GGDRGCALLGHVALDLAPGEEVALEVRRGAGSWRLVDRFTESANLEHGLQADGEAIVSIRFRLIPNGADEPDLNGVQTSDLVVYCLDTAPGAGGYALSSGTSMAAPHVAGAAGLLLAVQPDLSVDELREALLSTVTPESTLAGKTVTGGSLDLAAAMAAIQPPLDPETDGDSDQGETEDTAEDGDSGDSEGDRDTGAEADDEGTADEDGTGEGHSAESDSAESELLAERLRASVWAGRQNLRRRGGLVFRAVGNRDTTLRARAVIRWRGDRVWLGSHFSRPIRLRPMSKWTIEAGRPAQLRMPVRPAHIRRVVRLRRLGARPVAVLWVLVSAPGQTAPPLERLVLRVG
ncbi:MAG TPA: S8 family serine peptidase, partial [Solirubrobacterales bacterium]|nr:S8 family serine peptidase [Solirubrobacterales bacterium]